MRIAVLDAGPWARRDPAGRLGPRDDRRNEERGSGEAPSEPDNFGNPPSSARQDPEVEVATLVGAASGAEMVVKSLNTLNTLSLFTPNAWRPTTEPPISWSTGSGFSATPACSR